MSRSSSKFVASVTPQFAQGLKDSHIEPMVINTSDAEFIGFPVRPVAPGDRYVRLCICRGYVRDYFSFDRRQKWEIVDVDTHAVRRPAVSHLLSNRQFENLYAAA